jgi:uncharacterized membrane protein
VEIENTFTSGIWEMEVGRTEEFSIEVYNFGNGDDTISIEVIDIPDDLEIEIELDSVLLRNSGSREIWIRIKQNEGEGRTGIIKIKCSSSYDGIQSSDEIDINYRTEKPTPGPSMEIWITMIGLVFIGITTLVVVLILKGRR